MNSFLSGCKVLVVAGAFTAGQGFASAAAQQGSGAGATTPAQLPAGATPVPDPQVSEMEFKKLQAETAKLQEELRSLRVTNEAIGPRTKWFTALMSAGGGALLAAAIVYFADRRLKHSQKERLNQERDLEQEKQNLALFTGLGAASFRTRIASASVLLQRLDTARENSTPSPGSPSLADREIRTIVNVLVSAMKDAPATEPRVDAGEPAPPPPQHDQGPAAAQGLAKFIADNLMKSLGAVDAAAPSPGSRSPLLAYDFQRVELDDVYWRWLDARGVDFFGSSMTGSSLRDARFSGAKLLDTDLSRSTLRDADLSAADLRRANLTGTDLRQANLTGANLAGAQLSGAKLGGARFDGSTRWPEAGFDPKQHGLVRSRAEHYAAIMLRAYESGTADQAALQAFVERRAGLTDGLRDHALGTIDYVEAGSDLIFERERVTSAETRNSHSKPSSERRPIDVLTAAFGKPRLAAQARDLIETTREKASGGVARMLSPEGAAMLAELCKEHDPRLSVELGTYTGLSALTLAASTQPEARVWTCDVDQAAIDLARQCWEDAGLSQKIESRVQTAESLLGQLRDELGESSVDLVLLDANFDQYADYFDPITALLKPEGLLVVDDPSWWGLSEPVMVAGDAGTRLLHEFLAMLRARPDYEVIREDPGVELLVVQRSGTSGDPSPAPQ